MRLLLINPRVDLHEYLFSAAGLSGLGTLYTAGLLRRTHDVTLVDSFLLEGAVPPRGTAGIGLGPATLGADHRAVLEEVDTHGGAFDAVVINKARWWSHKRRQDLADFLGGLRDRFPTAGIFLADMYLGDIYLPPYDPCQYVRNYPELDGVLHGAGEGAVKRLVEAPREQWPGLPGLAWRAPSGEARSNGASYDNLVERLDDIAPPAYDMLGVDRYVKYFMDAEASNLIQESHEGRPLLALLASRGCNHVCSFCVMPQVGMKWRNHSIEWLERTMQGLEAAGGVSQFVFNDPTLNHNPLFFKELLRMMVRNGYRFTAPSGVRADRLDDETLALFKASAPVIVTSLETPDFEFSKRFVKKALVPERVTQLARRCAALNLPLKVHYVIGMPGETPDKVNETLSYALYLYDTFGAEPLVQIATPIPGTEMERTARAQGIITMSPEDIAKDLPAMFHRHSVIDTPELPAETTSAMYRHFSDHVLKSHPRELTVVLDYACNNHCGHCLVRDLDNTGRSLDEHRARILAAVRSGIRTLVIEGGEATLHPQVLEIMRYARETGMTEVMMESNGRVLAYPRWARALATSGLTMLFIAAHGPTAAVHDATTQASGSFEQTVAGVRNMLGAGFRNIGINLPLTRRMARGENLRRTIELYWGLGARRFVIQYLTAKGAYGGRTSALPTYEQVLPVVRSVLDEAPDGTEIRVMNMPFCVLPGYEEHVHADVNNVGELPTADGRSESIVERLAHGKQKDEQCERCEYGFLCTGFLPMAPRVAASGAGEGAGALALPDPTRKGGSVPQVANTGS